MQLASDLIDSIRRAPAFEAGAARNEGAGGEGVILTSGGRLNHVADGEPLDGLVLGGASRAVGAPDGLDVAAALLVAAVVLPLLGHFGGIWRSEVLGERFEGVEGGSLDAHTRVAGRLVGCRRRENSQVRRAQVVIFGRGVHRACTHSTHKNGKG